MILPQVLAQVLLPADTQCGPQQREKLERLCRYITRPALGHKRLRCTPAGEVVLQLKTPYRKSTVVALIRKIPYYSHFKKIASVRQALRPLALQWNNCGDRFL